MWNPSRPSRPPSQAESFKRVFQSLAFQRSLLPWCKLINQIMMPVGLLFIVLQPNAWTLWLVGAFIVAVVMWLGYAIWLNERARRLLEKTGFNKCTRCGHDLGKSGLLKCRDCNTPFDATKSEAYFRTQLF